MSTTDNNSTDAASDPNAEARIDVAPEAAPADAGSLPAGEPVASDQGASGAAAAGVRDPHAGREPIDLAATTALLRQHFPALFSGGAKPVKLRIQQDIQARAPGIFTRPALSAFLRRYTGSTSYLIALAQAKNRFDLDGQPSAELSEEHRQLAADELARRRALQQERRGGQRPQDPRQPHSAPPPAQPRPAAEPAPPRPERAAEDEARRRRATLLRDFQATTLTKANFCALKRIAPDELDKLLEQAEQERKADWSQAPQPQLLHPRDASPRDDRRRDLPRHAQAEGRGHPGPGQGQRDAARPRHDTARTDDRPPRPQRPEREAAPAGAPGATPTAPPTAPTAGGTPRGERPDEVGVSYHFAAPPARVFAAWTDPVHLAAWWPREQWTLTTGQHELRAGGAWRFVLRAPDGTEHPNRIDHVGIFTPERLVYNHGADDDSARWFRVSLTVRPQGTGSSLKMRLRFPNPEEREAAVHQQHLPDGVLRSLQRLEAYLATPAGEAATPALPMRKTSHRKEVPETHATAVGIPAPTPAPGVRVHAEPLRALVRAMVERGGSGPREAGLVAQYLVEANLTGHDSHGVGMLPRYVENLLGGGLFANRELRVVADTGALLTLDGQAGYGQVMGHDAMALGIERARAHGVAVVGLANSHHIGRIGQWAEQCLAAGLVSVHFVNVISHAVVAPYNGTDGRFVTNPMCVGIPVDGAEPIVLDFATSRIAVGKVRVAYNKGEKVGRGILIDSTGRPTVEPSVLFNEPIGALLPFGEHKGYGLAVVCEILGGALSGGITMHALSNPNSIINNMTSFIVDPARMGTAQRLSDEARAFAAWVKASPPRPGQTVMLPGDPERERRRVRGAEGIEIDATTWSQLLEAGRKLGLDDATLLALAGLTAAQPEQSTPIVDTNLEPPIEPGTEHGTDTTTPATE